MRNISEAIQLALAILFLALVALFAAALPGAFFEWLARWIG